LRGTWSPWLSISWWCGRTFDSPASNGIREWN